MGEIEYIYQMYKDQEGRIFSLDAYQDGSLMDLIQETIEQDLVFVVVNPTGEVMAHSFPSHRSTDNAATTATD